jgi:hypothetical protein
MSMRGVQNGVRTLLAVSALGAWPATAGAQTLVENSAEIRFQLDLHVPDAVLAEFIPAGWTPNIAAEGAAKDANLRAIFVDRVTINGPDGAPVGSGTNQFVYLAAPVTNAAGMNVQLIIGGLTADPSDAPGPLGVYLAATEVAAQRSTSATGPGNPIIDTQDWSFTAAGGEHIAMHIEFERGVANRRDPRDVMFYSADNPETYQIWRQAQVLDILRNVTTNPPDRVHDFSFEAGGGSWDSLFDDSVAVLSWDNIIWVDRATLTP